MTFEGFYEWMVHSQAYAENEWKGVQQWNPPTTLTLAPGESKTYGVKFLVSDSIRNIEPTLVAKRPPGRGRDSRLHSAHRSRRASYF